MNNVQLYDTTLRDGTQQEGISLSVEDKIRVTSKLDELGVAYIEGGWPGSNPKDVEYFQKVRSLHLRHATIAAFGSTRRAGITPGQDSNLQALLNSGAPVLTLVGKSWDMHVTYILETTPVENIAMIADSVAYLRRHGRRVFFDAEHFFDGFNANPEYALACVRAASEAGAETVILCDTNGGTLPNQVQDVVAHVRNELGSPIGIHAHNDCDVAVANSLAGVLAGAIQVQGTINGYGERCGNANLLSVAANLKLKLGIPCLTNEQLSRLTDVHRYVSEVVNIPSSGFQPFVGTSAFSHKGGLHGSAVAKLEDSYQHIKPVLVGNSTRMVVSELAGRGNITYKLREMGLQITPTQGQAADLIEQIKIKEAHGYQYESAEASLELLIRRAIEGYSPHFELVDYRIIVERRHRPANIQDEDLLSEATVKIRIGSEVRHTAAVGNGPVHALDAALRKALLHDYPMMEGLRLIDYKVKIVDQGSGTGATVRVLIESTNGIDTWQTVGASTDIIEASWQALVDSFEYWLSKHSL